MNEEIIIFPLLENIIEKITRRIDSSRLDKLLRRNIYNEDKAEIIWTAVGKAADIREGPTTRKNGRQSKRRLKEEKMVRCSP